MFSRCPTSLRLTLATLSRSLHTSTWTCGGIPTPTAPRVKRPSPYRLLLIHTFLSSFAPLHVAGWRLVSVPKTTSSQLSTISIRDSVDEEVRDVHVGMYREADHQPGDLQDRRLIRSYQFAQGRLGWQDCSQFISRICVEVQSEDHHPTILISPSSEYTPNESLPTPTPETGYVVQMSTHTHTPLPPLTTLLEGTNSDVDGSGHDSTNSTNAGDSGEKKTKEARTMRPGVTMKDLRLAERVERVFDEIMSKEKERLG